MITWAPSFIKSALLIENWVLGVGLIMNICHALFQPPNNYVGSIPFQSSWTSPVAPSSTMNNETIL